MIIEEWMTKERGSPLHIDEDDAEGEWIEVGPKGRPLMSKHEAREAEVLGKDPGGLGAMGG